MTNVLYVMIVIVPNVIKIRNVFLVKVDSRLKTENVFHVLILIVSIVHAKMIIPKIVNVLNVKKVSNMCIKQMNVFHVNIHIVNYV